MYIVYLPTLVSFSSNWKLHKGMDFVVVVVGFVVCFVMPGSYVKA